MKTFKEWLLKKESGTSTASVAVFMRPAMGSLITRPSLSTLTFNDQEKPHKKKKKSKKH